MPNDPLVIIEKRESTVITLAKIFALVCASPFILAGGVFAILAIMGICAILIGSGTMVATDIAPWILAGIILVGILPAVRTRISGKRHMLALKAKIQTLEQELSEARLEVLKLNETTEFHRKLEATPPKPSTPKVSTTNMADHADAKQLDAR